ncbi:MAG: acetylornithine transaminase [Burkholderiaceae bacterium]
MNNADHAALMAITARPDIVFTHGQGSWLRDSRGGLWLDFIQGWAVNTLGHCPPAIIDALDRQSRQLINPSPAFFNEPSRALAERLCAASCFDQVFFTNSGAEANEGAIKLARKWGRVHRDGAYEIITFVDGFHGRTLATMSASGKPGWDTMFAPQVPGFPKATLNDIASVEALIGPKTVAIMLEPVQGESGVRPATEAFMRELRALCDKHRLLLIADEVQTGVGRIGYLFAHQAYGVEPDIMTLAKGLGGGVPIGALLAREAVCVFEPGEQGGTFNGNPLMTAVGLAVLEQVLTPGFLEAVRANGEHLTGRLKEMSARLGLGETRGSGLLQAIELGRPIAAEVVTHARDTLRIDTDLGSAGLLLNAPRATCLRFMPALNVSKAEIDLMMAGLEQSIQAQA